MQDFSIGILSWHSTDVLINTLTSYYDNGLTDLTNDITIYFQEITDEDRSIASHFSLKCIGTKDNVGIGQGFLKLAAAAKHPKILLLEHDWELIEKEDVTKKRIDQGLHLLDWGYDAVRYRHRENPGYPHFSEKNYSTREKALAYHDPEIDLDFPHLLDSVHWLQDPSSTFPGLIGRQVIDDDIYYVATSRYANFSNNPVMYNKDFYIKTVKQFAGKGIELEGKISYHWARQRVNVAHGEGLFSHTDFKKHPNQSKS